ncbi:MAG: metalloregulator ArsR/SmtB family transcription factor [Anaerolineaceae bacterium]
MMLLNIDSPSKTEISPIEQQDNLFKALTHPAQIAILMLLRDGERCVCHLEAHLGYRQAYISQQLSVLREAGLVRDRRDGWNVYYAVVDPAIYEMLDAVQKLTGPVEAVPTKAITPCPCPHCQKPGRHRHFEPACG